MTDPVFLLPELSEVEVGALVELRGDEGRHAAVVRRIRVGEVVTVADGAGRGIRGEVVATGKAGVDVVVREVLAAPEKPLRFVAVQAIPKGDRGERSVEMMTELGVTEVVPWLASRCEVSWAGERGAKGLAKWRSTAREAAKQSRQLRIPTVSDPVTTARLAERVAEADLAIVLHEVARTPLAEIVLPPSGTVLFVIGPEGGIAPDELDALVAAGGRPALMGETVLRTSTAGIVALAALSLR